MKNQKNRSMKVYSQNGRNYKATPTIILKGQWLEEMGFAIGDYISVSCENGKLVITPDTERAELEQMKADFMEKETKKLQKRFQREKEELYAQFVAEKKAQYILYMMTWKQKCSFHLEPVRLLQLMRRLFQESCYRWQMVLFILMTAMRFRSTIKS